jgi:hypothetical protein
MSAELIVEDQAERIIRSKVLLEVLCGMNEEPPAMSALPMAGFMNLARETGWPRLP